MLVSSCSPGEDLGGEANNSVDLTINCETAKEDTSDGSCLTTYKCEDATYTVTTEGRCYPEINCVIISEEDTPYGSCLTAYNCNDVTYTIVTEGTCSNHVLCWVDGIPIYENTNSINSNIEIKSENDIECMQNITEVTGNISINCNVIDIAIDSLETLNGVLFVRGNYPTRKVNSISFNSLKYAEVIDISNNYSLKEIYLPKLLTADTIIIYFNQVLEILTIDETPSVESLTIYNNENLDQCFYLMDDIFPEEELACLYLDISLNLNSNECPYTKIVPE